MSAHKNDSDDACVCIEKMSVLALKTKNSKETKELR